LGNCAGAYPTPTTFTFGDIKMSNTNLPNGWNSETNITIQWQEGKHRGQCQLYAHFDGAKLVLDDRARPSLDGAPQAGETWIVYPKKSPNGHIVFVEATRKIANEHGEDPLSKRIKAVHKRKDVLWAHFVYNNHGCGHDHIPDRYARIATVTVTRNHAGEVSLAIKEEDGKTTRHQGVRDMTDFRFSKTSRKDIVILEGTDRNRPLTITLRDCRI
jgi:hypothetical protein